MILLLALPVLAVAQPPPSAEVHVRPNGNCGPSYLYKARGIKFSEYRPLVSFKNVNISITPRKAVIPGCMNLTIQGIYMRKPVTKLTAEFEMRIGGTPNPDNPKLKSCGRKDVSCGCGRRNTCLFCDFCKTLSRRQDRKIVVKANTEQFLRLSPSRSKQKSILEDENACTCSGDTEPGYFDIETEICTPSRDELEAQLAREERDLFGDATTISMFTTVYLYDGYTVDLNLDEYQNAGVKRFFELTRNAKTIGCFFISTDVQLPDTVIPETEGWEATGPRTWDPDTFGKREH